MFRRSKVGWRKIIENISRKQKHEVLRGCRQTRCNGANQACWHYFSSVGITSGFPVTREQSSRRQEWQHPIGAQQVGTAPFYGICLVAERFASKMNSSIKGGF